MKNVKDEAARWFARLQHAGLDHPDRGRFDAWLAASPAHAAEYAAIEDVWNDFDSASRAVKLADALERRTAAAEQHRQDRRKLLKRGILGLFVCAGTGTAAWRGWEFWQGLPLVQFAARTDVGETGKQPLPDGSSVMLGAHARIEVAYFRNRRVVTLFDGDAIFEVVRDGRPFVVEGGMARATVLGTRFAVNRTEERVRVSVQSGRVQVDDALGGSPVILDSGEVAEVLRGQGMQRLQASAEDGFAWQRGTLVFDNASLQEIATGLSRYRRQPIRAAGGGAQRITAVVQVADIEPFLQSLPTFTAVRVEHRGTETVLVAQ
jgi:transmembrane sensor